MRILRPSGVTRVVLALVAISFTVISQLAGLSGVAWASSTLNTVIDTITPGGNLPNILASPDGTRMYVPDNTGSQVLVISTATHTVTDSIAVGFGAYKMAITPDGSRLYVINWQVNTLSVVNTATDQTTATISLPDDPREIEVTPDGSKFVVSDLQRGDIKIFATSSNALLATVTTGPGARYLAFSPDSSQVYVANILDASVSVVDLATYSASRISLAANPTCLLMSADGSQLYVGHSVAPELSVISTATRAVTQASIGVRAAYLALDGARLLVSTYAGQGYITAVDTSTLSVLYSTAIPAGRSKGVFVTPDGSTVYTLDDSADRVFALSTVDGSITATIPMSSHMAWAAFTTDGSNLYVVASSGWIAIIDTFVATSSGEFDAPMQQFAVPPSTSATDCGALAPNNVDWPAISSMHALGWKISYASWPNEGSGGWVCSRQPHLSGSTWRFL